MMELLYKDDYFELFEYSPKITNLFGIDFNHYSFLTRIRFIIELLKWGGYKVYYLKYKNDYVASCIVSHGINSRYYFASESDIIVGPYYVKDCYRGKKFSEQIIKLVLNYTNISYKYAWDYINKNNTASIKASCRVGFEEFSRVSISSLTHKMKPDNRGQFIVFKYCNEK